MSEEKLDKLLAAMELLISAIAPKEAPAKKVAKATKKTTKRGRPKKQVEVEEDYEDDDLLDLDVDPTVHSIKPKKASGKKKFVNTFNPAKIKKTEDEGSEEYKRIKDGGIVKSRGRQSHKKVFCNDCKKHVEVITELARKPYYCSDYKIGQCRNAR